MNLVVDTGNTHCRAYVMCDGRIVRKETFDSPDSPAFLEFAREAHARKAIVSSTRRDAVRTAAALEPLVGNVLAMTGETPVPIGVDYSTRSTLGTDRIAAAVGAVTCHALNDALIVDVGTAITIDLVENGIFRGGNISPGVEMRARALAEFTAALPKVPVDDVSCGDEIILGESTASALMLGIVQGVALEIEGYVSSIRSRLPGAGVVLCGGGAKCLGNRIKNAIFASCELPAFGLNAILEYNGR